MDISRIYILPVNSDTARVYEWDTNHLTMEELISFIATIGKIPENKKWIQNESK